MTQVCGDEWWISDWLCQCELAPGHEGPHRETGEEEITSANRDLNLHFTVEWLRDVES